MTSAIRTAAGPSADDLNRLLADVYRRYRQGEVGEQTAYREAFMVKAMIDGMTKSAKVAGTGGAPLFERIERVIVNPKSANVAAAAEVATMDLTKLTDDELETLKKIIEKTKGLEGGAA